MSRLLVAQRALTVPGWAKDELSRKAQSIPSLDLRFAESKSLVDATTGQSLVTFTRASSGTYVGSDGLIKTATTNEARFDHNPTTGESLGLLVEEQRTNSVRNNTMVGAVAGAPGTNPTNWGFVTTQSNGLTQSIIGTGTENGINYIDYRFNGTTVASPNAIAFGIETVAGTAATGQTWTGSAYFRLVNGSLTGVTSTQIGLIEVTSGGAFVAGAFYTASAPTSASLISQRATATRTLSGGATVATCQLTLNIPVAGSTAIDFTLRIGLPQLEQGAFATSVIPTSGATVTRSADVASISGSNFSSWFNGLQGTMFASGFVEGRGAGSFSRLFTLAGANAGTDELSMYTRVNIDPGTNGRIYGAATVNSVLTGDVQPPAGASAGNYVSAFAYRENDFALASNGFAPSTDTSGSLPTCEKLLIYGQARFQNMPYGTIKRFTYWPQRLPNSTLQAVTQ